MADPTKVASGLADLAMKVKQKADQAKSNQATCKILVSIGSGMEPVHNNGQYKNQTATNGCYQPSWNFEIFQRPVQCDLSWVYIFLYLYPVLLLYFQVAHISVMEPVIHHLEDKICEEDERLQDFVDSEVFFIWEAEFY